MRTDWDKHLSSTVKNLRPSPIREILSVIHQPGMISLAGGMPAPEVFPVDAFYEGVGVLRENGHELLQYGTTEGNKHLREYIASWQEPVLGRKVQAEEILLTTGSQQVIDLMGWTFLDTKDVVIAEEPTYLSALSVFENHGAYVHTVPVDAEGMNIEALPGIIEDYLRARRRIKFIYTIPNFQNPTGATLSYKRREKLVALSEYYHIPIVEDDPYGYIRYDGEPLPALYSFAKADNVLYVGTFSKVISPGVRTGWVVGDKRIVSKLAVFKQFTDMCSSPITQGLLYEYCKRGHLKPHINKIIANYRIKRDAMEKSLQRYLAPYGIQWDTPEGGFFFWVDFGSADAIAISRKALEKKVAILPAHPFSTDPAVGHRYARLNFTYSSPEILDEGIRRLSEAYIECVNVSKQGQQKK